MLRNCKSLHIQCKKSTYSESYSCRFQFEHFERSVSVLAVDCSSIGARYNDPAAIHAEEDPRKFHGLNAKRTVCTVISELKLFKRVNSKLAVDCSSTTRAACSSGLVRAGTSSCARASRYHTNAIAVNDFTIATRKWAKLYKPQVRRSVTR